MKKKLIAIFLAILTGAVLAVPALVFQRKQKVSDDVKVYVLQTGAYKSYENALEKQSSIENSILYKENDTYLVLVGASTSENSLSKIAGFLQEENVDYYKKTITIFESDMELFQKYNFMLEKAEKKETVLLLNQKILERVASNEL